MEDPALVVLSGSEPDRVFRALAPKMEPWRHFCELDRAGGPPYLGMPVSRAAIDGCAGRSPGLLVVAVREHFDELTAKLRKGDRIGARREAGLLGHYLADAAMPFHATRNFDGWETGNRGIHRFLEVTLFKQLRQEFRLCLSARALAPPSLEQGTPEETALNLLRGSIRMVPALLALDCRARPDPFARRRVARAEERSLQEELVSALCARMAAALRGCPPARA